jgi:hypothetical protein
MDYSFDLPSEPRLSNTILKNRPVPLARTRMKQRKNTPLPIDLDNAVPIESKLL